MTDEDEVLRANQGFYEAFEATDFDAMSDLWEHSDRISCVHPGWSVLRGWGSVAASWAALFQSARGMQFILTEEQVHIEGDTAWVTVDENIIGPDAGATVAALNVFVRAGERWQMVAHHGSGVAPRE